MKLKIAKSSNENTLALDLATSKSHKIYKHMNSLRSSNSLPPSMHLDYSSAKTDCDKAFLFNEYFHSIFTRSPFTLPAMDELPAVDSSIISDVSVTDSEVFNELSLLDTSEAMGIDSISPKTLRHYAPALYLPIHQLFSL